MANQFGLVSRLFIVPWGGMYIISISTARKVILYADSLLKKKEKKRASYFFHTSCTSCSTFRTNMDDRVDVRIDGRQEVEASDLKIRLDEALSVHRQTSARENEQQAYWQVSRTNSSGNQNSDNNT